MLKPKWLHYWLNLHVNRWEDCLIHSECCCVFDHIGSMVTSICHGKPELCVQFLAKMNSLWLQGPPYFQQNAYPLSSGLMRSPARSGWSCQALLCVMDFVCCLISWWKERSPKCNDWQTRWVMALHCKLYIKLHNVKHSVLISVSLWQRCVL